MNQYQNEFKNIVNYIASLPTNASVLIGGHENPDGDSVASLVVMKKLVESFGKKASILINKQEIPNAEIFNSIEVDKMVDSKVADLFILLDCAKKSRLGVNEKFFDNAKYTINIDHHENNLHESNIVCSCPQISATCEILYELFKNQKIVINKETAELLFSGICSDTFGLSRNYSKNTFSCINELSKLGIDCATLTREIYLKKSEGEMRFLAKAISEMRQTNGLHSFLFLESDFKKYKVSYNEVFKKIVPELQNIDGVKLLLVSYISSDGEQFGELRSSCQIDVDVLATELGGGGHKKASGFHNKNGLMKNMTIINNYIKNHNHENKSAINSADNKNIKEF
ncbi:MAG: DHH family phosphoesterase [Clostridia bacterium]